MYGLGKIRFYIDNLQSTKTRWTREVRTKRVSFCGDEGVAFTFTSASIEK